MLLQSNLCLNVKEMLEMRGKYYFHIKNEFLVTKPYYNTNIHSKSDLIQILILQLYSIKNKVFLPSLYSDLLYNNTILLCFANRFPDPQHHNFPLIQTSHHHHINKFIRWNFTQQNINGK